jgi:hypothetical protein
MIIETLIGLKRLINIDGGVYTVVSGQNRNPQDNGVYIVASAVRS